MMQYLERLPAALKLDARAYRSLQTDAGANAQAALTLAVSSLAAGLGRAWQGGFYALCMDSAAAAAGWLLWSWLAYFLATRLLPESPAADSAGSADPAATAVLGAPGFPGFLRAAAFASAPGVLQLFAGLPFFGGAIGGTLGVIAWIWMSSAFFVAVRAALGYSGFAKPLAVCALGWMLLMCVSAAFYFAVPGL